MTTLVLKVWPPVSLVTTSLMLAEVTARPSLYHLMSAAGLAPGDTQSRAMVLPLTTYIITVKPDWG